MRIRSRGKEPVVDATAFVAPTAVLAGDVRVGAECRIMYGAVLDSEGSRIEVGPTTIINEHAVLRATAVGDEERPVVVGDHVLVGPHASLLGCTVEPCSYIATGATVLHGATVRSGANVAVGAVVHANAVVPREFFVPPNTIAVGDPLEVFAPGDEGLAEAVKAARFAASAFGVKVPFEDRINRYRASTEVRSEEFGAHLEDVVLDDGR